MDIDQLGLEDEAKQALQSYIDSEAKKAALPLIEAEVSGLKNKNSELLGKLKEQQTLAETLKAQQTQAAEESVPKEYKEYVQSLEKTTETLRSELNDFKKQQEVAKMRERAVKLAASLTKDPRKGDLLQKEAMARLTLVEGEVKVLDDHGQVSAMTMDELEGSLRHNLDFLVDGSQAQGGGAVRSEGEAQKPMEMSRDEFRSQSPAQKMDFIKSGGTIIE